MKNLLIVYDGDYPWDVRVEKICNSFVEWDYEIHLICRNKRRQSTYQYYHGTHIHRLPKRGKKLNSIISFPFFLNPIWLKEIYNIVITYNIDAILVRDLPMTLASIIVSRLRRLPCFLDMAEPYPEMLEGYDKLQRLSSRKRIINFFVRNPLLAQIVEKISCQLVSHIFPVSDEIKDRLIKKGVNKKEITVIHNTPNLPVFSENDLSRRNETLALNSNGIILIYIGDLTEARGLPVVIHSIRRLVDGGQRFRLIIVGAGRFEHNLKKLVLDLDLEDSVFFAGWVPHSRLPLYLRNADVGIIPHLKISHNDLTIPNKLFDCMAFGVPVIASNLVPIKRILMETNSGLVFEQYTIDSLVETLLKLKNVDLRLNLGRNGQRAVQKKYNWKNDFARLIGVIDNAIQCERIYEKRTHSTQCRG